ncbi:MAG: LLM class flavin-dependent oxidoreductase [Proteobacteria bacterium]|jgi:5,10-methylenetetrahydromethanopterin reductase|nr:LLM class flavin-dependent oxidoreductase [Pseudomonadota bacterium]
MELGLCAASKIDDIDYLVRAEQLGYTHAWIADSHMLWSDPYAVLALAATRTRTLRLGTGVAVAPTRPAPVTAASIATINRLAPGRVFLGVGTGNTAMRVMGHKPMPIAEFDTWLTTVKPLLRGEEASFHWRGKDMPIRHLMPDAGFVNFVDPIPLYVSGFGPRALGLVGKHGDGAVLSIPPDARYMTGVWRHIEAGAAAAGRDFDRARFRAASLTTMVVLNDGEARDSARVRRLCGAFAMASLHYTYDRWRQTGQPPGRAVASIWSDYCAYMAGFAEARRHQHVHRGHNCWVEAQEQRFLTADLMESTCMIGTASELIDRLGALGAAGLDEITLLPPFEPRYEVIEQVAAEVLRQL